MVSPPQIWKPVSPEVNLPGNTFAHSPSKAWAQLGMNITLSKHALPVSPSLGSLSPPDRKARILLYQPLPWGSPYSKVVTVNRVIRAWQKQQQLDFISLLFLKSIQRVFQNDRVWIVLIRGSQTGGLWRGFSKLEILRFCDCWSYFTEEKTWS